MDESALIIVTGLGLSASLARLCASNRILAARNNKKLESIASGINAETIICDAGDINSVSSLFENIDNSIGIPNHVIYNPLTL